MLVSEKQVLEYCEKEDWYYTKRERKWNQDIPEKFEEFNYIVLQVTGKHYSNPKIRVREDLIEFGEGTCLCNQPHLCELNFIEDTENDRIFLVGNKCVERVGGEDVAHELRKKGKRILYKKNKEEKKKQEELERLNRRCNTCKALRIPKEEPRWKKDCLSCYWDRKNKESNIDFID